ncbi:tetratricopeptide repeat protein [Marinobacter halodurans]|uniref:Tetratricopeptide repeat protein n=1 Tax=Marinobacter halodurans TaxID=2528979 RepID=A0ABY1ZJW0_9GAMM|nr:tetratricopeptide repeat protein [Marinobacter halodurans]TBW50157.1 tetratricopeptide repeat protein [Marinobacter halodurans]
MSRRLMVTLLGLLLPLGCYGAGGKGSFQVNLGEDGETIGEMRPIFLEMSSQQLPAISVKEVARRYKRLFEEAEEPEVRIDALHRLTSLHSRAGASLELTPQQEAVIYREALKSYEMIVSEGRYQGRLDELLYQTAKAYAFIGEDEQSIKRLRQLVGLYPQSSLATEARFRIAEDAFSRGAYAEAEQAYQRVIDGGDNAGLQQKALYMLGWSQYKQQARERASHTFLAVLDGYRDRSDNFAALAGGSEDLVNDTFRILALMAAQRDGAGTLDRMLAREGGRAYDYLLYDRLADYYLAKQRYADSAAVNRHFIDRNPAHPRAAAMRAQIVAVWEAGGFDREARQAREDYVQAYAAPAAYAALSASEQVTWRKLAGQVADALYHASGRKAGAAGSKGFADAGRYYGRLGDVNGQAGTPTDAGRFWRLAGDAWLQAGNSDRATAFFEKAGYQAPDFGGAADAAWAAVLEYRKQPSPAADESLTEAVDRFARVFPDDQRAAPARADLANRLLAAGNDAEARREALQVTESGQAAVEDQRAAYLVLGQIAYQTSQYPEAEQAYRQALALAASDSRPMPAAEVAETRNQLARSIYRQAEVQEANGQNAEAIASLQRIPAVSPDAKIAMNARYDAATMMLESAQWEPAIDALQAFRHDYPGAELTEGVSGKLVLAYTSAGQPAQAAEELLQRAENAPAPWDDRLQAADLLLDAGDAGRAHAIISDYLAQAPAPGNAEEHGRQQRLRHQLIVASSSAPAMRQALLEQELASEWHSPETLAWAANAALVLADREAERFNGIALVLPLKTSLKAKRRALEAAVARYDQARRLGDDTARSQALYGEAELFRKLARDIMDSERPGTLNELEQAQYGVLLEEQAYPFEEKAIDLHARNHQLIADGVYNRWVRRSLDVLGQMYPGRYKRDAEWINWTTGEVDYARADTR